MSPPTPVRFLSQPGEQVPGSVSQASCSRGLPGSSRGRPRGAFCPPLSPSAGGPGCGVGGVGKGSAHTGPQPSLPSTRVRVPATRPAPVLSVVSVVTTASESGLRWAPSLRQGARWRGPVLEEGRPWPQELPHALKHTPASAGSRAPNPPGQGLALTPGPLSGIWIAFPKWGGVVRKGSRNLALRSVYPKHRIVFCDKDDAWPHVIQTLGQCLLPIFLLPEQSQARLRSGVHGVTEGLYGRQEHGLLELVWTVPGCADGPAPVSRSWSGALLS